MANDGTGSFWDESNPGDGNPLGQGAREIRDVRIGMRRRMSKEHLSMSDAAAGGEHKKGSAVAYYQTQDPNLRPGGDALDEDDDGRLFFHAIKKLFKVWSGQVLAFITVRAPDPWVFLSDRHTANADGGTITAGQWTPRPNWGVAASGSPGNLDNLVTILGGTNEQFRLVAGTWRFDIRCPGFRCDRHKTRLWNDTDGAVSLNGTSAFAPVTTDVQTVSDIIGEVVITGDTVFEVQHNCQTTRADDGMGQAANLDSEPEVFATMQITRVE